jgi:hypothetical protein
LGFAGQDIRVVLDEDVPSALGGHLRARGFDAEHVDEIRDRILERRPQAEDGSISDEEVCREVAERPSVLITLNLRDYSDPAMQQALIERWGVPVVQVRVSKRESRKGERPRAIHDIVHRHAHKLVQLELGQDDDPLVMTLNRSGLRRRRLSVIQAEQAAQRERAEKRAQEANEKREREAIMRLLKGPRRRVRERDADSMDSLLDE